MFRYVLGRSGGPQIYTLTSLLYIFAVCAFGATFCAINPQDNVDVGRNITTTMLINRPSCLGFGFTTDANRQAIEK
jgi:hypothetical protein